MRLTLFVKKNKKSQKHKKAVTNQPCSAGQVAVKELHSSVFVFNAVLAALKIILLLTLKIFGYRKISEPTLTFL